MPIYETTTSYAIRDGWRTIEATVTAQADDVTVISTWSQPVGTGCVPNVTREVVAVARRHAEEMLAATETVTAAHRGPGLPAGG